MIEILKQMVDALEFVNKSDDDCDFMNSECSARVEDAIEAGKQAIKELESQEPVAYLNPDDLCADTAFRWCKIDVFTKPVYTHPPQRKEQEPVECDGDFPEGFDKSLDIPAQALRQANAALCEVTNNRMWDVPALAERMLMFCRNTHPPQRKPLTNEQAYDLFGVHYNMSVIRNVEAAHGIKE